VQARQSSGPLAIGVVSLTEIAGGMRSPERREVMRLLGSMQRFEVSGQVAWRAATLMREYRRSRTGIGLGDYLIAATALTEGLELATLNLRHYPMFPRTRPALPDLKHPATRVGDCRDGISGPGPAPAPRQRRPKFGARGLVQ
jgi:predicted nucleic acid-binding protein